MAESSQSPLRALMFMSLAVVAGGAALVVTWQLFQQFQARIDEARKPEDTVMVVVAARELFQGVTITDDDLYAVEIPPGYLSSGVFLSYEHVIGRIPKEHVLANEYVRAERLADPVDGLGLNVVLPGGMRALSVNIAEGHALSGFLNPGNTVDILVTRAEDSSDPSAALVSKIEEQAITVLAVNSRLSDETRDQARDRRGSQSPNVTLLVTMEQAERIASAERTGNITLALRNDLDHLYADTKGSNDRSVLGLSPEPVKPRYRPAPAPTPETPAPEAATFDLILGGQVQTLPVIPNP